MNRMLGWIFDPSRRGRAALPPLSALCTLLGFPTLEQDLLIGEVPEVLVEASPDPLDASRQPDLLIRTANAALLLENKVLAPESGENQYADYLELLHRWAGGREHRAYLMAPSLRSTPEGWQGSLTHAQLANELLRLVTDATVSMWDRIVYAIIANDLDPQSDPDTMMRIDNLLHGEHLHSDVVVTARLAKLLGAPTIDPTNGGNQNVD